MQLAELPHSGQELGTIPDSERESRRHLNYMLMSSIIEETKKCGQTAAHKQSHGSNVQCLRHGSAMQAQLGHFISLDGSLILVSAR